MSDEEEPWKNKTRLLYLYRQQPRNGLAYLHYTDYVPKEYPYVNLSSLVEAKLYLCPGENYMWEENDANRFRPMNLLKGLKNVETLNLQTIQTSEMFQVFRGILPVFEKLSHLLVDLSNFCWFPLPMLIKKSPNLKTLTVNGLHYRMFYDSPESTVCLCVSEYSFLLSCPLENLKITEYYGSLGELINMQYILGKLSCLELVEVRSRATGDGKKKLISDLQKLHRASSKCKFETDEKLQKMEMRTKSIPVRSSRKSLDPHPSLPERFGSGEIVPDTCDERDVPHKKRHCLLGTGREEPLKADACLVCEISDMLVSRCSGIDCIVRFHRECLTPEFGGSEDLANPFCPYCWFKVTALKSKSWRDKVICAEKAVFEYLHKDSVSVQGENAAYSSKEDQVQFDKDSHQPEEGTGMKEDQVIDNEVEASGEDEERVATDDVHDAEDDDESAGVQTKFNTDVSLFLSNQESYSGKEHDQVQQSEKRRRRRVETNATDSEMLSTMERNGEGVAERREHSAATKVTAESQTVRDFSFFNKDQRRRLLWTSEEEEMLRVGVEKYAAEAKRNMPWRKIREMGEKVFYQTRTPADLKDKWRNMLKAPH